jgi:hypothetical protein
MRRPVLADQHVEGDEPADVAGLEPAHIDDVAAADGGGRQEVEHARLGPADQPGAQACDLWPHARQGGQRAKQRVEDLRPGAGHGRSGTALGRLRHIDYIPLHGTPGRLGPGCHRH